MNKEFKNFVENDPEFVDTVIKQEDLAIHESKKHRKEHTHDPILKPHRISFAVDKTKNQSSVELEQIRQLQSCLERDTHIDFKESAQISKQGMKLSLQAEKRKEETFLHSYMKTFKRAFYPKSRKRLAKEINILSSTITQKFK